MLLFNTMDPDPRVWKEAETLASNGATVCVYALRGPGQAERTAVDGFEVCRFTRYAPTNMNPPKALKGVVSAVRALWNESYDVYHCHDAGTLPVGYLLSRVHRAALVYDSHEYAPDEYSASSFRTTKQRLANKYSIGRLTEPFAIRRSSRVITVGDSIARLLKERYNLRTDPLVLRNVPKYIEPKASGDLRTKLGLGPDAKMLLYQGVVAADRGVETCIEVLDHIDNAALVILGRISNAYKDELSRIVSRAGVESRVHMMGQVPYDQLLGLTVQADVGLYLAKPDGISTSFKYSLPNKSFEFIMARIPQVVSNLPEIKKLVEQYGVGIVEDPRNLERLLASINRVLHDTGLRNRLRDACERAAQILNWENEERSLLALYESLPIRRTRSFAKKR